MDRTEWLNRLEALHVRRRDGDALPEADLAWYDTARRALLATAIEVQARPVAHGERTRGSIRVSRPVHVLLEHRGWAEPTFTVDLGTGGFAVLLEAQPPMADRFDATLLLPGGSPLRAAVAVVDTRASGGLVRIAFAFSEPTPELRARIEDTMMDGVLEQLVFWDDVLAKLEA
jgi:hypothetical protein